MTIDHSVTAAEVLFITKLETSNNQTVGALNSAGARQMQ